MDRTGNAPPTEPALKTGHSKKDSHSDTGADAAEQPDGSDGGRSADGAGPKNRL